MTSLMKCPEKYHVLLDGRVNKSSTSINGLVQIKHQDQSRYFLLNILRVNKHSQKNQTRLIQRSQSLAERWMNSLF